MCFLLQRREIKNLAVCDKLRWVRRCRKCEVNSWDQIFMAGV